MQLIGMPEAGRRLGVSSDSARRALANAGVQMLRVNARAWAVSEKDLKTFMESRADYAGRGRPRRLVKAGPRKTKKSEVAQ